MDWAALDELPAIRVGDFIECAANLPIAHHYARTID
jgi:hypothetical protein